MKFLLDAGVLPGLLDFHVNINWGRFVIAMLVFAGLLAYMVYAWMKR